jgi:hypothetical protein
MTDSTAKVEDVSNPLY